LIITNFSPFFDILGNSEQTKLGFDLVPQGHNDATPPTTEPCFGLHSFYSYFFFCFLPFRNDTISNYTPTKKVWLTQKNFETATSFWFSP
jgi:hypothetical protein